MTSHTEIMYDWSETCEALALEYWESNSEQEAEEYAHECADGSQWVIYYDWARDLVAAARLIRPRDLEQAESGLGDMDFESEYLERTMTLLAYCMTYSEVMTQIIDMEPEND